MHRCTDKCDHRGLKRLRFGSTRKEPAQNLGKRSGKANERLTQRIAAFNKQPSNGQNKQSFKRPGSLQIGRSR